MTARVLVVDADQQQLTALRGLLALENEWDVEFVDTGATALERLTAKPADVIVADVRLPDMDDGQLLSEVRRRYPDTARLLLSGSADEVTFTNAVGLAHQFIRKPCVGRELQNAIARALRLRDRFDEGDALRGDVSQVAVLPSPSPVFFELIGLIDSATADARSVAALVERDVGLSAKVLQVVNSALFAPRSRITAIDAAVVRLGLRVLRSLALAEEVQREFVAPPVVHEWVRRLNDHGYEAAQLARELAPSRDRDDAFCAALLQECGQLVFARSRPGVFAAHIALREERQVSLAELELETFGFTHAQAGAYLLSLWGFPPEVVDAVAVHDALPKPDAERDLRWAVQVANKAADAKVRSLCGAPGRELGDDWFAQVGVQAELAAWAAAGGDDAAA